MGAAKLQLRTLFSKALHAFVNHDDFDTLFRPSDWQVPFNQHPDYIDYLNIYDTAWKIIKYKLQAAWNTVEDSVSYYDEKNHSIFKSQPLTEIQDAYKLGRSSFDSIGWLLKGTLQKRAVYMCARMPPYNPMQRAVKKTWGLILPLSSTYERMFLRRSRTRQRPT